MKCRTPERWLAGLVLVLALSGSGSLGAEELDEATAVKHLISNLSGIRSLEADFRQWVSDTRQTNLQDVYGRMWVQRPGQFRWDTREPFPQQIIVNDQVVWVYDVDLEQVTQRSLGEEMGNTPALLLTGDPAQLLNYFQIGGYHYVESGEWRFDLQPRSEEAMFELLRVHFLDGKLIDMFLRDSLGQTTRIEFSNHQQNQPLDENLFKFEAPEGVDVISEL